MISQQKKTDMETKRNNKYKINKEMEIEINRIISEYRRKSSFNGDIEK